MVKQPGVRLTGVLFLGLSRVSRQEASWRDRVFPLIDLASVSRRWPAGRFRLVMSRPVELVEVAGGGPLQPLIIVSSILNDDVAFTACG